MIYVLVTSQVREGCMDGFLTASAERRERVKAEPGCLSYEHIVGMPWPLGSGGPTDPNRVILVEVWDNEESIRRHAELPYGKEFVERVRGMRESVTHSAFRTIFA